MSEGFGTRDGDDLELNEEEYMKLPESCKGLLQVFQPTLYHLILSLPFFKYNSHSKVTKMSTQEPILFLWGLSAWASKVTAYLALRGIPYTHCEQPIYLPRPDITALGVNYRRIPILALGRDIYCDSLLILQKLDEQYPPSPAHQPLAATDDPKDRALEKLLEKWTDVVVFKSAAAVISTDLDLMKDPGFQKDRENLWGRPWSKEAQDALRAPALAEMRLHWDFLEELLSDGRTWVLGNTGGPKLADIHACWIFDWLLMLPGSFPEGYFNETRYPNVLAWRERYNSAISQAKEAGPQTTKMEGKEAVEKILNGGFNDKETVVEGDDPSGLKAGQRVTMRPVDTGYTHEDVGELIGLTGKEAVISTRARQGDKEVHVHYPRWNYTFEVADG